MLHLDESLGRPDLLARKGRVLVQQRAELAADALELDEDEVLGCFSHGAILSTRNGGGP